MSKRTLMMIIAMVASLLIATTSTLAYLTSEDGDVNVMTVGNVEINQIEEQRPEIGSTELENFEQFKPILPGVYDNLDPAPESQWPVPEGTDPSLNEFWSVYNENVSNAQDKFVSVENTGNNDAYVRTFIAYECPEELEGKIHLNYNDAEGVVEVEELGSVTLNGVRYNVLSFVYPEALEPGQITVPSLKQVLFDKTATSEDMALLGENFDVIALSQAVQADGFDNAEDALDEAFYPADTSEQGLIDDLEALLNEKYPDELTANLPETNWSSVADTSWYSASETTFTLDSAEELAGLAQLVANGTSFSGKTVKLGENLDLSEHMWTPIGNSAKNQRFTGTFDGQGKTISNLYVQQDTYAGLFGCAINANISNVNVEDAIILTSHYAGAVLGSGVCVYISDCRASDVVIQCIDESGEDGDKAGGIVGYLSAESNASLVNCIVEDVDITANRDAGALAGMGNNISGIALSGNTISNCTVTHSGYGSGANFDDGADNGVGRQ